MTTTTTTSSGFTLTRRLGRWWGRRRQAKRRAVLLARCAPATLAAGQMPPELRAAWAHHAPQEFPGLATGDEAWLRCSLGFAQFLEACRLQRDEGPCALPSKAADSVWHVWLRLDPVGLAAWQQRCFGREVSHRAVEHLGAPLEDCIARSWAGACRSEGLDPLGRSLPMLFALDGALGLPSGWAYGFERGGLMHRPLDGAGLPSGAAVSHLGVSGDGLAALGLVSQDEVLAHQRRMAGGGSDGFVAFSSDSGSCDNGSHGGSSSCDGGSSGSSCGGSSCGGGGS